MLYQKHRPTNFSKVIGNEEVVSSLQEMVSDPTTCPHSILLTGPTGCGKTTLARIIANEIHCHSEDINELDIADFRGIDTIREIRKKIQYRPIAGDVKVWILDECHKLTNDAQNALLKMLEDTPSHVFFILCTTDPQKLLGTIKGRCSIFALNTLTDVQILRLLKRVVKVEKTDIDVKVLKRIALDSLGHPRNAIQILDQVLRVAPDLQMKTAMRSAEQENQSIELCRALLKKSAWKVVSKILEGLKNQDPETIRRHVLGYSSSVLLKGNNDTAALILEEFYEPFYNTGFPGLIFVCYTIINS